MSRPYAMKHLQRGFTLIEILVVAFIIGMTASLIAISIGDDKDKKAVRVEAQSLIQAIDFVSEYTALNGDIIGLFATPRDAQESLAKQWCYSWQRLRDNVWSALPEGVLPEHCLPPGMQWELVVENQPYIYDPDLEVHPPALVFSPSGEVTPVTMTLFEPGTTGETQHIVIDMMGASKWLEQEKMDVRDEK